VCCYSVSLQCVAVCCSVWQWVLEAFSSVVALVAAEFYTSKCCSVLLQCVSVSRLRCVAMCFGDFLKYRRFVAAKIYTSKCCGVLQCVAVCCSVLQCVKVCFGDFLKRHRLVAAEVHTSKCCGVLQCVAMCCSVLQCVAVCCSVLQCVFQAISNVADLLQLKSTQVSVPLFFSLSLCVSLFLICC